MNRPSDSYLQRAGDPLTAVIQRIQTSVLAEMQRFAVRDGLVQLMPVLTSPFTDPLNHDVYPAQIDYAGRSLRLTASMIFHKQLALIQQDVDGIFILSPNIRLEKSEVKGSDNHLIEFSQFDVEFKNATMDQVMNFVEALLVHVFDELKRQCSHHLAALGRELPPLQRPFPRYTSDELHARYGGGFEMAVSRESPVPCFVTNFKREFYDREDPGRRGAYRNFDLIYSDGFGEALSGAEREYEHPSIVRRMLELDMDLEPYRHYLEVAERGLIPRTAGCGIGIERLLRFICGRRQIGDVCLFDRSIASEFTF